MSRRLILLWLAGIDLRLTLLAVPPVLPLIHRELGLDEKGVAILSGLPVLLFGTAALAGSLLIARIGARRALLTGLWLIAIGSALRGVGSAPMLFAMTFVMGAGIAICQPTFPALVSQWFSHRVARATGFWSNGLLVGEVLSAALTIPLILPLVGSWRGAFVFWSIPVMLTAIIVAVLSPHAPNEASYWRQAALPNWRRLRLWQVGFLQASASLVYFGGNTFIPDYLHATNQPDLVAPALTALNGGQLPASLVIGLVPLRVLARGAVSIGVAVAILFAGLVVVVAPGAPTVVAAGIFGFCAAYILVLSFALPPLLAAPGEVASMSGGTFAISYTTTFVVTLLAGAAWDATHLPATAFLPVLAASVLITVLAPRLVHAASAQAGAQPQASQHSNQPQQAEQREPA
jgi:CP family cyanate transporter-like MFS transporter